MKYNLDFSNPEDQLAQVGRKLIMLSLGRLFLFLLTLAVLVVGISGTYWLILCFFPLSFLFIFLILKFNLEKDREKFLQAILHIQEDKSLRKIRNLTRFDEGQEFIHKSHPYATDLDLFGVHSLFQLINHTVSKGGKKTLANWMMNLLKPEAARQKNQAVKELSSKKDFLFSFEALGKAFLKEEKPKNKLYDWLKKPTVWRSWYFLPMTLGPIGGFFILTGVLFGLIPAYYLSLFIFFGLLVLALVFKPLLEAGKVMPDDGDLKTYQAWSDLLEKENFADPFLLLQQSPIKDEKFLASKALKELQDQSFMIQNRINMMYLIFNLLFWVDFLVLFKLERWKKRHGEKVQLWDGAFENWEALVSMASFMEEESQFVAVQWLNKPNLVAKDLKHPLIPPATCIANDFSMNEQDKIVLLTGSNMSGKTTFMRTIGINIVLAGMGLSPLATSFSMGAFQLYTSMRNTDSLGESVSSFYAELSRIKGLLDQAKEKIPTFFLLDEILKGTNTSDRILGSEALITQLSESFSKGIISTHDIELSVIADKNPFLVNYSFHHDIHDEEIVFDYKIKKGPCPNFNAQKLMELMGIKV